MVDRSLPETMQLVWDANAGAFGPPRAAAESATRPFIKGPLSLPWLHSAAAIPGKALHVALGLLFVKGLCCSSTVPFKRKVCADFGVSSDATYDALARMEEVGLISVVRHRGRSPVVTILDAPS